MVEMKSILYTISTFFIMLGVVAFLTVTASTNIERGATTTEQISSQRIYYYWNDIRDNFADLLNVSAEKKDSTAQINDTLPAELDIKSMMDHYQSFIEDYFEDGTIEIRFEDGEGNEINLEDLDDDPKIMIKPMNINYSWPSFGKNEMFLRSTPENFSFIERIIYTVVVDHSFNTSMKPNPKVCPAEYCLDFLFTVKNSTFTWVYPYRRLDIDFDNWIEVEVAGEPQVVRVETGDIKPGEKVLHIKIIKSGYVADTYLDIIFNTTEFYINYPAVLNVTTPFGRKVDYL